MNKLRVVIVDNEEMAIAGLRAILEKGLDRVQVVGEASDVKDAIRIIKDSQPDVIFLDVEISGGSGFDVLEQTASGKFEVVFVTAHNSYAVKAIKFSALDYIIKPIDIDEVLEAVKKVEQTIDNRGNIAHNFSYLIENMKMISPQKLGIPTSKGIDYVTANEIVSIEGDGNYCHIHFLRSKKRTLTKTLLEMQYLLYNQNFFRAHKSHIVNLKHVDRYMTENRGQIEMVNGSMIPLSREKREAFKERMKAIIVK